ncbi:hypothetical protein KAU08_11125 [bacterium]|nr:hypothetical protein [bacterium]
MTDKDKKVKTSLGRGLGYAPEEPYCPVCLELGFREKLHNVEGLPVIAPNPQAIKGAPRVVDCVAGCRYSLEPYYNPRSDGTFCYILIKSERNINAIVNHYWFHPDWIYPPL